MIDFINLDDSKPYKTFFNYYKKAVQRNQKSIEAIVISSFDKNLDEVNSRFVNLKFIKDKEWIFILKGKKL